MANATERQQDTQLPLPMIRPISWTASVVQMVTIGVIAMAVWKYTESLQAILILMACYFTYALVTRLSIPRLHRRGMKAIRNREFEAAIPLFKASYDFFNRHVWLDNFRVYTMLSTSAFHYREMALMNLAFAHSQLGNGKETKECYQKLQTEFPGNAFAHSALQMIDAVTDTQSPDPSRAS